MLVFVYASQHFNHRLFRRRERCTAWPRWGTAALREGADVFFSELLLLIHVSHTKPDIKHWSVNVSQCRIPACRAAQTRLRGESQLPLKQQSAELGVPTASVSEVTVPIQTLWPNVPFIGRISSCPRVFFGASRLCHCGA